MLFLRMIQKSGDDPNFRTERSRSEKAILGALRESRGCSQSSSWNLEVILGIQNPILRMASHDLSTAKTTNFGATPRVLPGIDGNLHTSWSFFSRVGQAVPAYRQKDGPSEDPL